jgi:TonB-linked SusC/RagA family outer membrane protein
MSYEILDGLKLEFKLGSTLSNTKQKSWYPEEFGFGRTVGGGIAFLNSQNSVGWLNDNLITYNKTFADHRVNVVAGFSQQAMDFENFGLAKYNFDVQSINVDNIGSGTDFYVGGSNSNAYRWSLRSWLWRANYSFKDKYIFTATGRSDGSSKFPEGKKWAFFPSGGIAWRISEEPFFQNLNNIVNDLKFHASYGLSGNQAIPPYASRDTYAFSNYIFGNAIATGMAPTRLENRGLSWETTSQLDIGLDINLFDSRINLNAVYYEKLTEDLLMQASVPFTTGYEDAWKNTGSISNHGMEFSLNTINIETRNFTWSTNFNISFNRNMVKSLDTGTELDYVILNGPAQAVNMCYILQEGKPIGSMYGLIWDGIYQLDDFTYDESKSHAELLSTNGYIPKEGVYPLDGNPRRPGNMKFKDIAGDFDENGNPVPDGNINQADRTIIGNANPKHFGGFSNEFSYKNFELSFLMNWSYGNDILNQNLALGLSLGGPYKNQYTKALERWTPDNPTNELYAIGGGPGGLSNSFYVEDGSFLRLSNITFGYNLPMKLVGKWNISGARIFLSGDNLHVWTKYSGYDPEVSIGDNALTPGTDFSAYPRSRTVRVGIKLDF